MPLLNRCLMNHLIASYLPTDGHDLEICKKTILCRATLAVVFYTREYADARALSHATKILSLLSVSEFCA